LLFSSYCQENNWIEEQVKIGNGEYAVSNIMICPAQYC